jgi:nicotinamide-nucleotide amidase
MTAAILSTGTEVTRGELINTNAAWLAERLTSLGFEVREHVSVDDHTGRIIDALRRLCEQHAVVVCTGGLGPTSDDLTSEAVARVAGVPLVRDDQVVRHLEHWYASRGRVMPEPNRKQADFPRGAHVLPNEVGTAPGFAVTIGNCVCACLPGVPAEMKPMFDASVVPLIAASAEHTMHQLHIRTFGLPESTVAQRIADIERQHPEVTVGYRARFPEVEVKVLAHAASQSQAQANAEHVMRLIRERLGDHVYGGRYDSLASVVGRVLREQNKTLALAESCTGGLVGAMLTEVAGASAYFASSAVTYTNAAKTRMLGVPEARLKAHGAVSAEVAHDMAAGVLETSGADIAVAITGIAGPEGGTDDKPVGLVWFGVAQRGLVTQTVSHRFHGDRGRIRTHAAHTALDLLRRALQAASG